MNQNYTKMASESISEHLEFKIFLSLPQTPYYSYVHTCHSAPPNEGVLPIMYFDYLEHTVHVLTQQDFLSPYL